MVNRRLTIGVLLALYVAVGCVGITWGLPTSGNDSLLFGDGSVWDGDRITSLSDTVSRTGVTRGADVDADPVVFDGNEPVDLCATAEGVAAIYRRYRLFTHQPDEMITMMALAGMQPRELRFDPKLYQYGGWFIYPVGAMIGAGGVVGLIEVSSDLTYYLDNPGEFGKFYVAARVYVLLWGALGVLLVHALAVRLGGWRAGFLAGLLFVIMPVVVCMSHEAKPHLPGAVLMLAAVWWAGRYVDGGRWRDWAGMCLSCGVAFGMVLSSLPIFILIPLAEWMRPSDGADALVARLRQGRFWRRLAGGAGLGICAYLAGNPYVAINAIGNQAVLRSNLSNSTAMYEVSRLGEGLGRVIELTAEGAGTLVFVLGVLGLGYAVGRRRRDVWLLFVPAALVFVQFVLLGAGKPAEYGRFGVFPNTALAISTACVLAGSRSRSHASASLVVASALAVLMTGIGGAGYLYNFHRDSGPNNTRAEFGRVLVAAGDGIATDQQAVVCVLADPAPYGLPPLDFSRTRLLRYPSLEGYLANPLGVLVLPADHNPPLARLSQVAYTWGTGSAPFSPISWANKPMVLYVPQAGRRAPDTAVD